MFAEVIPMEDSKPYVEVWSDDASLTIPRDISARVTLELAGGRRERLDCYVWQLMALIRCELLTGKRSEVRQTAISLDVDEHGYALHTKDPITGSWYGWVIGRHDALDEIQSGHYPTIPDAEMLYWASQFRTHRAAEPSRAEYVESLVGSGQATEMVAEAHADNLGLR